MKLLILAGIVLLADLEHVGAATAAYVAIPASKLTVKQALELASPHFGNHRMFRVVSIDWAKASTFQPRIKDGTIYNPADHAEDWSWFFTCMYSDETDETEHVLIIRILDSGELGYMLGTRT